MDIAPVGANSFAMRSFGRHIGVGCAALSRMNSLPQSRTPYGVLSLLALNLFPDRGRPRLQTAVLRPGFFFGNIRCENTACKSSEALSSSRLSLLSMWSM